MKQSLRCHGMQSVYNDFESASPLEILRRLVVWAIALVAGLVLLCCGCKQIDWPVMPWTNAPAILPTTTTTIPPTPTPTIPPAPARNLAGNYMPELCNPTYQWPALNFAYWETRDNGAKGVPGMELPAKATWILADGQRVESAQGGGWFYLQSGDARTIAGPISLEIVGRDGKYTYRITDPAKSKSGIMPFGG